MKRILIVEDDAVICKELKELLENASYEVFILKDFVHAFEEFSSCHPDLVLLDIHIPYLNGNLFLQEVRKTSNVPIIMVTSKNSEADEVLSMSFGADDYITKPYNPNILLLRIGAVLKRTTFSSDILKYRDTLVYLQKGILKKDDNEIILTKNEMIIFYTLFIHQDKVVTRDELMTELWNNEEYINDNALTVNISRLRNKLKLLGIEDAIDTRKKVGYILK